MGSMRKSRLSKYKQDRLIEHFVAGTTARTASITSINKAFPDGTASQNLRQTFKRLIIDTSLITCPRTN